MAFFTFKISYGLRSNVTRLKFIRNAVQPSLGQFSRNLQTLNQLLWSHSLPNSIEIGRRCINTSILPYKPKGKVWLSVHRTARNSERANSIVRRSCAKNVAIIGKTYTNCVYSQVHNYLNAVWLTCTIFTKIKLTRKFCKQFVYRILCKFWHKQLSCPILSQTDGRTSSPHKTLLFYFVKDDKNEPFC